jgi:hypothetical protein
MKISKKSSYEPGAIEIKTKPKETFLSRFNPLNLLGLHSQSEGKGSFKLWVWVHHSESGLIGLTARVLMTILPSIGKKIRSDYLNDFQKDSHSLDSIEPEFLADKKFVLDALKIHPAIFHSISKELKVDKNVVLAAVKQNVSLFDYISSDLQQDRDVFLAAVKGNGLYLEQGSALFQADQEIIQAALKQNPEAARYAIGLNRTEGTSFKKFDPSGPLKSDFF